MKRALIFSLAYFPKPVGGAEVAVKEITDRITDIEFHLITLRFHRSTSRKEKIGNVHVYRIGFGNASKINKIFFQLYAPLYAWLLHRKLHFDCMWAVMAHSSGVPAAIFKILRPEVKYILNLQEGDPPSYIEKKMSLVSPLFKRAFTSADIVQPLSIYLASWARHMGFTGPIVVVPNAVDAAHFSQTYPARVLDEVKDNLGKRMGDVFLVTTSRLVHKNAIDTVISALRKLPEHVHLIVLGDGPLKAQLTRQIRELKLESRVKFLGHVGHTDLPKYLQACDIFVRPSRSEGFGASFVEAFAAGLPVIATQEGGLADFLFDERKNPDKPITGFVVRKDSPEDVALEVRNIMEHPEKVRAVVATARALARDHYDWNLIARTMRERVFKAVLDNT